MTVSEQLHQRHFSPDVTASDYDLFRHLELHLQDEEMTESTKIWLKERSENYLLAYCEVVFCEVVFCEVVFCEVSLPLLYH